MTPGDRHGYLVVLRESSRAANGGRRYVCLCACGRETTQRWHDLRAGNVVSCGCIGRLGRIASLNARNVRAAHEHKQRQRGIDADSLGILYSLAQRQREPGLIG